MSVLVAYSIIFAFLTLSAIALWNDHPNWFVWFCGLSVTALSLILWSDSPYVYRIGPHEYIVNNDSVITHSDRREVRVKKPEGKIRSYGLIITEITWNSARKQLLHRFVLVARGSPTLAEKYFALKDSLSSPFDHIQKRVRSEIYYHEAIKEVDNLSPVIELVGIRFSNTESRLKEPS
jgi:hypothetical protein